jgi:trk system potassium uptake protein TrkH
MIIGGINFSLYYFLFKGKLKKFFKDEEIRVYLMIIAVTTILVTISLINFRDLSWENLNDKLRNSLFSVTALISTTGFYSVDYSSWVGVAYFLLLLTFIGGCAGSTSGGVKVIRVLLVFKYCYYEFKRMIHPNAVFPVRYNSISVKEDVITKMLAYLLLYVILSLLGAAVLCLSGFGFEESISTMVSCLGNVGPGLGHLGPIDNYHAIPVFSKWFLSFAMLVGRLEFFTVLLIFTPAFWKK